MERVVFSHVPRTGGSWVRQVLKGLKVALDYRGHNPVEGSPPDCSLTVVRHPCDWLESWYRMCINGMPASHVLPVMHGLSYDSSEEFVKSYLDDAAGFYSRTLNEYAQGVEVVIHTENLAEELCLALELFGYPIDRHNVYFSRKVNVSLPIPFSWPTGGREAVVEAERAYQNEHCGAPRWSY